MGALHLLPLPLQHIWHFFVFIKSWILFTQGLAFTLATLSIYVSIGTLLYFYIKVLFSQHSFLVCRGYLYFQFNTLIGINSSWALYTPVWISTTVHLLTCDLARWSSPPWTTSCFHHYNWRYWLWTHGVHPQTAFWFSIILWSLFRKGSVTTRYLIKIRHKVQE